MSTKTEQKVDELKAMLPELGTMELDVLSRPFTLADAIREGSLVSTQAIGWGDGDKQCALHAAVISARAHNLI